MTDLLLRCDGVSFRYRSATSPSLDDVSFAMADGDLLVLAGGSGDGKTTLLRCINGLIPRSYKGELSGRVLVAGSSTAELRPVQLAQLVGTVLQDPEKQIVASYVANEVAFGPENLGWPLPRIRAAINAALEELGIAHLAGRETFRLSGGEKQKVALAALVAMEPRLLLLDEPLASLDPLAARTAIEVIRAQADRGRGVLLVEHRVEDVLAARPDRALFVSAGRLVYDGDSAGLLAGADPLAVKLPAAAAVELLRSGNRPLPKPRPRPPSGRTIVSFEDVAFWYEDGPPVLHDISFDIRAGDRIALLGPNGSGKSTLVKHMIGLNRPRRGRILVDGNDVRLLTAAQLARTTGYVFQSPTHMLFAPTVRQELAFGPGNLGFDPPTIAEAIERATEATGLHELLERAPLSLSFGQQKRVGIAAVLAMQSRVLVLDEPTAGQDYRSATRFMDEIAQLGAFDAVLLVTHDLDLALSYANRVLLMRDGQIAADGPPETVLSDDALLRSCHVLPTTLLELNRDLLPRTGRFMGVRELAGWLRDAETPAGEPQREAQGVSYHMGGSDGHK